MDITHSPRHTRRGFLRGDSAPKFFPLVPLNLLFRQRGTTGDLLPPATGGTGQVLMPLVPPPSTVGDVAQAPVSSQRDFSPPRDAFFSALEAAASNSSSNAFLSWLAEQLKNEATRDRLLEEPSGSTAEFAYEQDEDGCDPYLDAQLSGASPGLQPVPGREAENRVLDFSIGLEATYHRAHEDLLQQENPYCRVRWKPQVELAPDGGRCENFAAGSKIIKDVLGRVVEVHSQFGDCLYFRYGVLGSLEHFERTDTHGHTHSEGHKDKHGVVVRDYEGRVRAAGETMAVDPRGCFYVHTFDGQYISIDLVAGIHSERRKVKDPIGGTGFVITSLFTHDGFRMATVFSGIVPPACFMLSEENLHETGVCVEELRFRFYGRDGTLIEFASEDDLRRLQPLRVVPPAARKVARSWQKKRQAGTAWDSVHEYLMQVS